MGRMRPPLEWVIATALAVAIAVAMTMAPGAAGAWSAVGSGTGGAAATYVAAAPAPTASLGGGSVTVRWSPGTLGEVYTVRRFDPSGSPAVPSGSCATTVAGSTCIESPAPAGTWSYAVRGSVAAWDGPEGPRSSPVSSSTTDVSPPTVQTVAVGLGDGSATGWIRPSGSFRVFVAAADDSGQGSSGVVAVTADISSLTNAAGVIALSPGGPWWAGGEWFGWRSDPFTSSAALIEGTEPAFTVSATDGAGNVGSRGGRSTVDTTPPSAWDVQAANGGTSGRADTGDQVILTFSEPISSGSLLTGWTGQAPAVVTVRVTDGGATGNDVLTIWDATNTTQVALGSVNLARSDYVSASVTFGSSSIPSTMSLSGSTVTVTFGPASSASRTTAGSSGATMIWTPSALVTDRAGNPCSTSTRSEGGARDREF